MRALILVSAGMLLGALLAAPSFAQSPAPNFDHNYAALDTLLKRHVAQGRVDYPGLAEDREVLDAYLESLKYFPAMMLIRFSRDQRMAFHINGYNAAMLALVLDHFPLDSLTQIEGGWDKQEFKLLGEDMNLEELADKRIHGYFREPLIHFALASACQGSPPLRSEAWVPSHIDQRLNEAAQRFARDPANSRLDREAKVLAVSRLFDWHGRDFEPRWGGTPLPPGPDEPARHRAIVGFLEQYGDAETAAFLKEQPVRIEYLEFDWSLNAQAAD